MSVKVKVLELLELNKGMYCSGQKIADSLGASRNAVWKAIKELRSEGYEIQASSNQGYLMLENDIVSCEGIKPFLENKDTEITVLQSVDSTNTFAKKLALDGAASGSVVVANLQTAGRGRLGRSFYSPKDTGVYMSVILKNNLQLLSAGQLTTGAAVITCLAIEQVLDVYPSIKWVNDIFVDNKKVGGILTEGSTSLETGQLDYAVIGIGLNFTTTDFPDEIKEIAQGLKKSFDGKSRNMLIAQIMNNLTLLGNEDLIDEYKKRCILIGKNIESTDIVGTATDIDKNGGLVVQTESGERKTLVAGEVVKWY